MLGLETDAGLAWQMGVLHERPPWDIRGRSQAQGHFRFERSEDSVIESLSARDQENRFYFSWSRALSL
jgi:hypothetical protein